MLEEKEEPVCISIYLQDNKKNKDIDGFHVVHLISKAEIYMHHILKLDMHNLAEYVLQKTIHTSLKKFEILESLLRL